MCEKQDCYSADRVERTENKKCVRCAKSKYRLVFADNHKRLQPTNHKQNTSKLSSIEDRGPTDRFLTDTLTLTLSLTSDLDLQSHESHGHEPYIGYANGQGQRSLGSKVRVETDGWRDGQTEGGTEAIATPPGWTEIAVVDNDEVIFHDSNNYFN